MVQLQIIKFIEKYRKFPVKNIESYVLNFLILQAFCSINKDHKKEVLRERLSKIFTQIHTVLLYVVAKSKEFNVETKEHKSNWVIYCVGSCAFVYQLVAWTHSRVVEIEKEDEISQPFDWKFIGKFCIFFLWIEKKGIHVDWFNFLYGIRMRNAFISEWNLNFL